MNIDQLRQLISQGESDHLEFKNSTTQLKAAFKTACAFLNGSGGHVLFGVKNNGELVGQQVTDNTKLEIANEIRKIEPNIQIGIQYIPLPNNLQVIVLDISRGAHVPYAYDGRPFERIASATSKMTQHRYEQLIVQRAYLNHNWTEFLSNEYSLDDLDHDEIRNCVIEGIQHNRISHETINYSIEQILTNFNLIQNNSLTNAALVLFCKTNKIFLRCEIKMARFRGTDKLSGFIDNQWETGNIFQLMQLAHHFANRHLPIASFFEPGKLERIDQPAVPQLALREALINAFCHRNYNEKSASPHLAIYDDRLEIWNPGGLLSGITLEQLKKPHTSFQRNELIANVFYKRGWIEKWGTGTIRMLEHCHNNGSPEPTFSEEFYGFSVVFPFKEPMNTAPMITHVELSSPQQLSPRQKDIITILTTGGEMSLKEIYNKLNNPPAKRTFREDMTILKKLKIVNSYGLSRATKWYLNK